MTPRTRRTPKWVWVVAISLASIAPATHIWIAYFPPEGAVPTGFHIADLSVFLQCMRMFETGFATPYATCKSEYGERHPSFFPLTYLWMYGAFGAIGGLFGFDDFVFLGFANGLGAFFLLYATYRLLRELVPPQAGRAFLLFSLSGGLGGVLFAITGAFGMHDAAGFEAYFQRYAQLELIEGPFVLPNTFTPRLYYVLPLALCTTALLLFLKGVRLESRRLLAVFAAPLFVGTFINFRVGAFAFGVAAFYLLEQRARGPASRLRLGILFLAPVFAGWAAAWGLLLMSPNVIDNQLTTGRVAMWVTPFVSVALFHLLLASRETVRLVRGLSPLGRLCAFTTIGYLSAFAVLFCGYQIYHGNILIARDGAVANVISDWALVGALAGGVCALKARSHTTQTSEEHGWVVLWLLTFLAVSISAFGNGWFLRFGPQRVSIFLWLPLCVLSALALHRLAVTRPGAARAATAIMVCCGVVSIVVASLYFQGPLGYRFGPGPFARIHNEMMNEADARAMEAIGEGTVLAPIPASDVVAYQRGNPVVFGLGTYNLSKEPYVPLEARVMRFFADNTSADSRRDFVEEWCVDYVYCPDTWPVSEKAVAQLRETPWLIETAAAGKAAVFKVVLE
ncbi:MAG TPA: hypothetical protein HPP77_09110 [Candidatus Hydrogenedentes bacterium]|nr:hypothetical protein [Candidatus Hydrogenedentota bacterium]